MDICYNLPKLEWLTIYLNQISGNIPPSLGTCMDLKHLSLAHNNFVGSIPMEIGNLTKLQILYLAENNLRGTFKANMHSYLRVDAHLVCPFTFCMHLSYVCTYERNFDRAF